MRARRLLPVIATGLAMAGGLAAPITAHAAPLECLPYVTLYIDSDRRTPVQGDGFCNKNYFDVASSAKDKVSSWHFRGNPGTTACLIDWFAGQRTKLDQITITGSGEAFRNVPSSANDRADAVMLC